MRRINPRHGLSDVVNGFWYFTLGYGPDQAWPALRLNSQKGGLKFDHFPIGPFGSEKCSPGSANLGLLESGVETKRPKLDHLETRELKFRKVSL